MTDPTLTPEEQAAKDRALLADLPTTVRVQVPIGKLLKRPMKYLRHLPHRVILVGVNPLGLPILSVARNGKDISARGQNWALTTFLSKLPPPDPTPDAQPE